MLSCQNQPLQDGRGGEGAAPNTARAAAANAADTGTPVLTAHNEGRLGDCFGIHVPGTEVRRCLWEEWRGLGLGQRDHWRSLLARTPVSGVTTAVMLAAGPHAPILQETRLRSNECSASPGSNVSDAIKSEPEGDQSPAGKHLPIVAEWWLLAYGSSARCSARRKQRPGQCISFAGRSLIHLSVRGVPDCAWGTVVGRESERGVFLPPCPQWRRDGELAVISRGECPTMGCGAGPHSSEGRLLGRQHFMAHGECAEIQ